MIGARVVIFIVLASLLVHPLDYCNFMINVQLAVQLSKVALPLLNVLSHLPESALILTQAIG